MTALWWPFLKKRKKKDLNLNSKIETKINDSINLGCFSKFTFQSPLTFKVMMRRNFTISNTQKGKSIGWNVHLHGVKRGILKYVDNLTYPWRRLGYFKS